MKEKKEIIHKAGYVVIVGRPNSGKSTLLNNLLKQKVSITSPKPQTTRIPIHAIYENERGQIIFVDTPGIFAKVEDFVSKKINPKAEQSLKEQVDVVVYLIDHSRDRNIEENKIIGIVRKIQKPKILVYNKMDKKEPDYIPHYRFLEEEFDKTLEISGLYKQNLNRLIDAIFELLPEQGKIIDTKDMVYPVLNIDSKTFISEIIREKAYLFLRKELPYYLMTVVDDIADREGGIKYIKARIVTSTDKYKRMIIGVRGYMIKEIGMAARKELEVATNQKVFLDLKVETNPHWTEEMI